MTILRRFHTMVVRRTAKQQGTESVGTAAMQAIWACKTCIAIFYVRGLPRETIFISTVTVDIQPVHRYMTAVGL